MSRETSHLGSRIRRMRLLKFILTKYFSFLLIALISSLGIFIFGAKPAYAISLNPVEWIQSLVGFVLELILRAVSLLLAITGQLFDWALSITQFAQAPAVKAGWSISRDLVNMLLVFILLIIAFAAILRVETYGIKALLPKLIGVALLVNFSLLGAGVVLDFTQVAANFFVDQTGGGSFSLSISEGLNIVSALEPEGFIGSIKSVWDIFYLFVIGLIGGIVIILTAAIMFALGAFLLLVRVIALWILLIIAPIAIFFMILPATRHLWSKWLNTFFRWAFFAPVYAFFVYLALVTVRGGAMLEQVSSSSSALQEGWTGPNFFNSFFAVDTILMYIMVFGLLTGGLVAARQMGIYGASGAIAVGKWFGGGAASWVDRWAAQRRVPGAGLLGKGLSKIGGALGQTWPGQRLRAGGELLQETKGRGALSPGAWKRAWPARRKEIEARAFARPTGALRDQLNLILSLGKERTSFSEQAEEAEVNRRKKEISDTNRATEFLLDGLEKSVSAGNKIDTSAYIRLIFEQNDQNEIIKQTDFGNPYGHGVNDENVANVTYDILKQAGFNEEDSAKIALDLGNISFVSGNYSNFGMGIYDKTLGRFKRPTTAAEIDAKRKAAAGKFTNLEAQRKAQNWHWNSIMEEDGGGNPVRLHETGKELLKYITTADIEQLNRSRLDFQRKIGSNIGVMEIRSFAATVETTDSAQARIIRRFAGQLELLRTGQMPAWYNEAADGELKWKPQ